MAKKDIVFDFAFDLGSEPEEVIPIWFVYEPMDFFMTYDESDDGWDEDDWEQDDWDDDVEHE